MSTTLETITFNYSNEDAALFQNDQQERWRHIELLYPILRQRCLTEIPVGITTSQRVWVQTRTNHLLTTAIMRLLYLCESFSDTSVKFNGPAAAVHVKAMVEPVLHIANLAWILENHRGDFERIRSELDRMAFGVRDGRALTTRARISQRDLYQRADQLMARLNDEEDDAPDMRVFQTLYQEANATGHHNFEGRDALIGLTDREGIWRPKNRKEWFVFMSSNIFQFFLHTDTVFTMSHLFINMIDHYLGQLAEDFSGAENRA